MVLLDLGHNNFDDPEFPTVLAEWLTQDGYVVRRLSTRFDQASLASVNIVISKNPLPARDEPGIRGWRLPTSSAFSQDEIELLYNWVFSGGAFLLQIEHMPMAGAAAEFIFMESTRSANVRPFVTGCGLLGTGQTDGT